MKRGQNTGINISKRVVDEIAKSIATISVRDTDFNNAPSVSKDDGVVIIQNGENKFLSFSELADAVSDWLGIKEIKEGIIEIEVDYDPSKWLVPYSTTEEMLRAIASALSNYTKTSDLDELLAGKVDKEEGKGLSEANFTSSEKDKLVGIANNAQINTIESIKINNVAQPIQNKAVNLSVPDKLSQLNSDSQHRTVSDTEKTTWNNKSEFSGRYNDLTGQPDLTRYITRNVGNLVNYYLKSETYTKEEVQQLLQSVSLGAYISVPLLPTASSSTVGYVYIAPDQQVPGVKNMYITVYDGSVYDWEFIGTTDLSMEGYATEEQLDDLRDDLTPILLTQAQYDALENKETNRLYLIIESEEQ